LVEVGHDQETRTSNIQATENRPCSTSNNLPHTQDLFGRSLVFFWMLEFGIWSFRPSDKAADWAAAVVGDEII